MSDRCDRRSDLTCSSITQQNLHIFPKITQPKLIPGMWEFLFLADFLLFENFLVSKFQLFLLFSAHFWHFTLISSWFFLFFFFFFACGFSHLLFHFENKCDVTAYFMISRVKTCRMLSVVWASKETGQNASVNAETSRSFSKWDKVILAQQVGIQTTIEKNARYLKCTLLPWQHTLQMFADHCSPNNPIPISASYRNICKAVPKGTVP